jgi:periplasmic copper chaperone A
MRQFVTVAAIAMLASCGKPAKLEVTDATVRMPAVPGNPGAAYFMITGGPRDETLVSVTSPLAIRSEMHDSVMDKGLMTMKPIAAQDVPAGGKIEFAPKGKHVMLYDINPKAQAARGTMTLTFRFASGLELQVPAQTMSAGDNAGHAGH